MVTTASGWQRMLARLVGWPGPGQAGLVATVIVRLHTVAGGTRLAQLAASTLYDAHTLDVDRQLGRGVARLLAIEHDQPRPQRAGRARRVAWAAAE
ncbi:TIGR02679 domain-containing protein [Amycolatopsis sp. NPDC049252]|uniref:TIGR02679 domain-containing protein n=1 Tax=Amycolatopsis sp. NPDC049252 TaxID=3363933 RepID=UPI003718AF99